MTFDKELRILSRTRNLLSILPARVRFRTAKALYNYESEAVRGVDLVAPLQKDGLVCFVNTKDLIGWKIFFFGEYEPGTNRVLARYIKPGDVVIEAGANIGSETLLIAKLVPDGQVYAFEPNPYTFERLKINISINELKNIHPLDLALGESDKIIHFNIFPKEFCNSGMASKYVKTPKTRKIDVAQKTLDTFITENNIRKVDFIKMDIQGGEMDMLNGAHETISRHHPIIFTEACEPYNDTKLLFEKLQQYGYTIFLINDNGTRQMNSTSDVKPGNWLALKQRVNA